MNTPKHTPGPWELEEINSDTGNFRHLVPVAEIDGDVISLLTVVEHNGQNFAAVYSKKDARLIAAAPDLLEALQEVSETFNESWREGSTQRRLGDLARAAIAKATGGAA